MEKEIKMIENELKEIDKFESNDEENDVQSFSNICGSFFTIICC